MVLNTSPRTPGEASFPVPTLLFGNLMQRWEALGGPALPIDNACLATWLHDGGCIVMEYRLQGWPVALSPDHHSLGFLGHITYVCRVEAPMEQQMLTALTRFAFFAGVGLYTAQGLGATQATIDP